MSTDRIEILLAQGEDKGCLNLTEVHRLLESLELEDDEVESVYHRIDERGHRAQRRLRADHRRTSRPT